MSERLNRMIFFGERRLREAITSYLAHYPFERAHQGLGNELVMSGDPTPCSSGAVERTERLGGLLRSYHRAA